MIKQAINFFRLRTAWLGEGGRPVEQELAQSRADVCLKCPLNVQEGAFEAVKSAVAFTTKKQVEYKNSLNLRVNGEKSLHICEACGCVNKLKVWVPIKHIKDTTNLDTLHEGCWVKKETETLQGDVAA